MREAASLIAVVFLALAQATASAQPPAVTFSPLAPAPRPYEQLKPEISKLARPVEGRRHQTLVDRPIVLDFDEDSWVLGLRTRRDERIDAVPAPGFPALVFQTRTVRKEGYAEYRRRVGDDLELGLHLPLLGLKETRPSRINPTPTTPFFTVADDLRTESGLGDVTVSLARAANRPRLSRRIGLDVKLANGRTGIPDTRSLPLGSGQQDYSLSYGIKRTRGRFAVSGQAGWTLRREGTATTLAGNSVRLGPGDEGFLQVRADQRFQDWWTASLVVEGRAGGRDTVGGVEQPGTARSLVAVTPTLTYQASDVFEVIASAQYAAAAYGVPDAPEFEIALRWRH